MEEGEDDGRDDSAPTRAASYNELIVFREGTCTADGYDKTKGATIGRVASLLSSLEVLLRLGSGVIMVADRS
jgi:hypothetical protein